MHAGTMSPRIFIARLTGGNLSNPNRGRGLRVGR